MKPSSVCAAERGGGLTFFWSGANFQAHSADLTISLRALNKFG